MGGCTRKLLAACSIASFERTNALSACFESFACKSRPACARANVASSTRRPAASDRRASVVLLGSGTSSSTVDDSIVDVGATGSLRSSPAQPRKEVLRRLDAAAGCCNRIGLGADVCPAKMARIWAPCGAYAASKVRMSCADQNAIYPLSPSSDNGRSGVPGTSAERDR